jgi:cbb3-type cytochrome oxidase maturation protein
VTILLVLIPLGLMLLAVAIAAFVWAVRHDQFDDLESEAARILFDDLESEAPRIRFDDLESEAPRIRFDDDAPDASRPPRVVHEGDES